jgi:hypothetical protein
MVATDLTALGQTFIGAAAAIGGGFVGAWWQAQSQQRLEDKRRRERAAEVTASAYQLLLSLVPAKLMDSTTKENYTQVSLDLGRRHAEIRVQLWVLASSYPSKEVRRAARSVLATLNSYLHAALELVGIRLHVFDGHEDSAGDTFNEQSRAASHALSELMKAIEPE